MRHKLTLLVDSPGKCIFTLHFDLLVFNVVSFLNFGLKYIFIYMSIVLSYWRMDSEIFVFFFGSRCIQHIAGQRKPIIFFAILKFGIWRILNLTLMFLSTCNENEEHIIITLGFLCLPRHMRCTT